ncbi:hypothetical protein ACCS53_38460, partial [Rhizobium ruizarguesonis]
SKSLAWFENSLITGVPWRYRGAGRRFYPGFLQLVAFMSMNMQRHQDAHRKLYDHLPKVIVDDESVSALDVSIKAQVINLMLDLK